MMALLASLALFGIAWLLHVAWWRIRLPRRHIAALLCLFAVVAVFAGFAWLAFPRHFTLAPADIPGALALYLGAAACYLILYTGVEQTSPTLVIIRALEGAGQDGCADTDLAKLITEDVFVRPRLEALALDGLVATVGDGWSLTPLGYRAARIASTVAALFRIRENA
jgi:hypothetical protein